MESACAPVLVAASESLLHRVELTAFAKWVASKLAWILRIIDKLITCTSSAMQGTKAFRHSHHIVALRTSPHLHTLPKLRYNNF
jgi:hypothetical protein